MAIEKKAKELIKYWKAYDGALVNAEDMILYWQSVYDRILQKEEKAKELANAIDVLNKFYSLINK